MKIGILTYHRSHNFGALYQAIASRRYIESLGHEVFYINYWPNYHRAMYSPFSFWLFNKKKLFGKLIYLKQSLLNLHSSIQREKRYSHFIHLYIEPYYAPKNMYFDAIFYGSDQIWRKQPYINDFNPVYFAHNSFRAKKHIALSASAGVLPITDKEKKRFRSLLGFFDSMSVREQSLYDMIRHMGFKVNLCCDPALLLTSEQWDRVFPNKVCINNGYLLFVNYIEDSFNVDEVVALAIKMNLRYICINGSAITHARNGDLNNVPPFQLFDYIRNADFVCTSSFHVLVFSILYHKQFYAAFNENYSRAESLLKLLGIEERLIFSDKSLLKQIVPIDFYAVDEKLVSLRSDTFDFIKTSLN